MAEEAAIVVDAIIGTKRIEGGGALIGLVSKGNILKLAFSKPILNRLALVALKAKTNCESSERQPGDNPWLPNAVDAFRCERWEVHKANDGKAMLLCFRLFGDAWVRLQIPTGSLRAFRETLEAAEGQARAPPSARMN